MQLLMAMVPPYAPAAEPLPALLKVHRDLARTAASVLPSAAASSLAEHCAELVRTYALNVPAPAVAAGREMMTAARSPEADLEEVMRYKQVKTCLQLLTHLASRDEDECDPSEAAYTRALSTAIGHLLPCVTPPLLQYPKLTHSYFGMLTAWLENRPLAAVSLPPELYEPVLASLGFGLSHHEVAICRSALETVYELARRASQHGGAAASTEALTQQLLSRVAADLLTSRLHPDVIDPAGGNALLALIVAQPGHWQVLAASLVAVQPTAEGQQRATALFGALLATNGVTTSLTRPNRTRFRANLDALLRGVSAANLVLPTSV